MGRELRRVSLDFDHPTGEVWTGFINPNPYADECPACNGSGSSPERRAIEAKWYGYAPFRPEERGSTPFSPDHPAIVSLATRNRGWPSTVECHRLAEHFNSVWVHHLNQDDVNALVEARRLMDFTHKFVPGTGWKRIEPPVVPSAQEVNEWSIRGFGHDAINQWIVVDAECARLGLPKECATCGGKGHIWESNEAKDTYEQWEPYDPPAGAGYQIWETVSKGSPISPVFARPEDLARWMSRSTRLGCNETSYEAWLAFINGPGWAPSMAVVNGGSGVELVAGLAP